MGSLVITYCKFTAECAGKRIMKIALMQLRQKPVGLLFGPTVCKPHTAGAPSYKTFILAICREQIRGAFCRFKNFNCMNPLQLQPDIVRPLIERHVTVSTV